MGRAGGEDPAEDRDLREHEARVPHRDVELVGALSVPAVPRGFVLFAHGSGSSRNSPRNRCVARHLQRAGFATLLLDLLTAEEEQVDLYSREHRFDIQLLAGRLVSAADWLDLTFRLPPRSLGLFGASTGAAAALEAAAVRPRLVGGVVSRGGRPDLTGPALASVRAPTLFIVGGDDEPVVGWNRKAQRRMTGATRLEIIPGATHLFEEPGALDAVAALATSWFEAHLAGADAAAPADRPASA